MGVVETYQNEWELEQLVQVYYGLDVYNALEVGAWHGGTLRRWLGLGRTVVVIDDEMRRAEDWGRWADRAGSNLVLLQGFSQDPELLGKAHDLGPYQFVFIDADHRYAQVKADWQNYREMVAPGGVVAFHDIIERPGYGVSEVWAEIKSEPGTRWMEIAQTVEPDNESRCGIGIVWM